MALTNAVVQGAQPPGAEMRSVTRSTFDTKYVTGGEPLTAEDLGLNRVEWAETTIVTATGAGVNVASADYDVEAETLLLYDETPAQVASEADVATVVVQVVAYGR